MWEFRDGYVRRGPIPGERMGPTDDDERSVPPGWWHPRLAKEFRAGCCTMIWTANVPPGLNGAMPNVVVPNSPDGTIHVYAANWAAGTDSGCAAGSWENLIHGREVAPLPNFVATRSRCRNMNADHVDRGFICALRRSQERALTGGQKARIADRPVTTDNSMAGSGTTAEQKRLGTACAR